MMMPWFVVLVLFAVLKECELVTESDEVFSLSFCLEGSNDDEDRKFDDIALGSEVVDTGALSFTPFGTGVAVLNRRDS